MLKGKLTTTITGLLLISIHCYSQKIGREIWSSKAYTVFDDRVVQGSYLGKALSPKEMVSDYPSNNKPENKIFPRWQLTKNIASFPQYRSAHVLVDALYNLSLEEMQKAVEPDSTFRTGARWSGVWTRDISYSIILSMAILQPEVAKKSLMRKVKNNRIIQDQTTCIEIAIQGDQTSKKFLSWIFKKWIILPVRHNFLNLFRYGDVSTLRKTSAINLAGKWIFQHYLIAKLFRSSNSK